MNSAVSISDPKAMRRPLLRDVANALYESLDDGLQANALQALYFLATGRSDEHVVGLFSLAGMNAPLQAVPPVAVSDADMRRLSGLWRFGERVLPRATVPFDAWIVLLDEAIDAAAPIPGGRPLPPSKALTRAAADVLRERTRQIVDERWTAQHDDGHTDGALATAAACYALHAAADQPDMPHSRALEMRARADNWWPFDPWWRKAGRPRRMLVKAAALLLAEIERIDRRDGTAAADEA